MTAMPLPHLTRVMDDLIAVLDAEIPLMMASKTDAHKELLAKKQRLLLDYEHDMKTLMRGGVTTLPADTAAYLRAAQKKLEEAVQRNARALQSAMKASQNLMDAVIDVIRKETKVSQTYRNPAAQLAGGAPVKEQHQPIAINHTV